MATFRKVQTASDEGISALNVKIQLKINEALYKTIDSLEELNEEVLLDKDSKSNNCNAVDNMAVFCLNQDNPTERGCHQEMYRQGSTSGRPNYRVEICIVLFNHFAKELFVSTSSKMPQILL